MMLFVELALIRWLAENVVYLSYFTNFVLLGSFLGIGLGFLMPHKPGGLRAFPILIFPLITAVLLFPVEIDRSGADVIFFGRYDVAGLPIWLMLPVIFVGVVATLFTIGQAVAREFAKFEPLIAYRLDITGSILGVIGFALLSWLSSPPVAWATVTLLLYVMLAGSELNGRGILLMLGLTVVLGVQSLLPGHSWSPYYKVQTVETGTEVVGVNVNGIPHQAITPIEARRDLAPLYFTPYDLLSTELDRVMIVGAGTGSDVAIALDKGAVSVDAVEIDPSLYELGAQRHPDHPYDDPRVTAVIDDGRAWMERSPGEYDLILFALPDSLTLVSGQSNLRLESFLFTQEAIDRARQLLSEDGIFVMYNNYREDWLIDRLAATLEQSFGEDRSCIIAPQGQAGLALLAAGPGVAEACPVGERDLSAAPTPVTDDYPFLYVRSRGIPNLYLVAMLSILVASVLAIKAAGTSLRAIRPNLDLFLMGAAFLLLETMGVVQFALWFGTTWRVNALVFAGILLSVLAAIEVARLRRLPRPSVLYGFLLISIGLSWAIPAAALLSLPSLLRFVAAIFMTFTPIFIANLVFAQRFATTENSTAAFGINLLGAMVGGILEYASLIVGYRTLAIIVGILYVGAFMAWRTPGIINIRGAPRVMDSSR